MSDNFDSIAQNISEPEEDLISLDDEQGFTDDFMIGVEERNARLEKVDPATIRKAWFTLSHLMLNDGAHIVDMGCDDGAMSYAMATINPRIKVTAVDKDRRKIARARETFKLDNLTFKTGDAVLERFKDSSVDAIINSFVLHEIYSGYRYNETIVSRTLEKQVKALKTDGVMFIRDYARPSPGEFVTLEIKDQPSLGEDTEDLSEADLLIWYSEHAQPRQDPGCRGFFLEELPARFPGTRLFRLPYKWAYEFIMRKDNRDRWETELAMDYTFFTKREFRKEMKGLAARVEYSTPHWDEDYIKDNFKGHFRLFDDNGKNLGFPETSYILVARKIGERRSLQIEERRPSPNHKNSLEIRTLRNEKTGALVDTVSRGMDACEVIPYRISDEGRLNIILHEGMARGIGNAVARSGRNVDGRRWSGHMVEPISVSHEAIVDMKDFSHKSAELFARDHLGLTPTEDAFLEQGPDYYPAPDYIEEHIHTYFLEVESPGEKYEPRNFFGSAATFQAKGRIREFDAQNVLDAITVGAIPNSRLELQILSLFNRLQIPVETWTRKNIAFEIQDVTAKVDVRKFTAFMKVPDKRFKQIRGSTAGQLRPIHSTFVEEGHSQGSITGLSSGDVDFVIKDSESVNTAVVIPLTKDAKQNLHAGFLMEHLPVPQRYEGNGATFSAPSFNIPPEVSTMEEMQRWLAEQLGVLPDMVFSMGESYYSHIGMTPQRVYPFGLAIPPGNPDASEFTFIPLDQMRKLWGSIRKDTHFMTVMARTYKYFQHEMRFSSKKLAKQLVAQQFAGTTPDWSIPDQYLAAPSLRDETPAPVPEPELRQNPEPPKKNPKPSKKTTQTKNEKPPADSGHSEKPRPEKW